MALLPVGRGWRAVGIALPTAVLKRYGVGMDDGDDRLSLRFVLVLLAVAGLVAVGLYLTGLGMFG